MALAAKFAQQVYCVMNRGFHFAVFSFRRLDARIICVALSLGLQFCRTETHQCGRDLDCPDAEICAGSGLCLPRDVAVRNGFSVGDECVVTDNRDYGCDAGEVCYSGFCEVPGQSHHHGGGDSDITGGEGALGLCTDGTLNDGSPLFGGVSEVSSDGADAILIRWLAAADETVATDINYLIYVSEQAGVHDFSVPAASVVGTLSYRLAGLTTGTTYYVVVRARDAALQVECNQKELSASPAAPPSCADFETMVQPIFNNNCIRCHAGVSAPRDLHLDSYQGVMAGGLTGSEIVACQPSGSLLYRKISEDAPPVGARMPFGGPYLSDNQIALIQQWILEGAQSSCGSASICSDQVPPTFAGLETATLASSGVGADLCWQAGADDNTASALLVYDVFETNVSGQYDFSAVPRLSSAAGQTCVDLEGLTPGGTYCWVVRARDAAGNRDDNQFEECLTVPAASCIDYATMVQPIFNANCTRCHAGASAPRNLQLTSYAGVMAGGLTGNEIVACQAGSSLLYQKISMSSPPVGVRMPFDGPPYLGDNAISLIGQWIAEGARPDCAALDPCSDDVPPSFGGLESAAVVNATAAHVCWSPGSDNLTPSGSLLYEVYVRASGEVFDFANPRITSAPGATCLDIQALSPAESYCFAARARDAAGNRDANVVEQCLNLPTLPAGCVEYDAMIAPLLNQNCTRCHAGSLPPQWLRLDTYEHVLAGNVRRNEIQACSSATSLLVQKVSATPPFGRRMPFDGPPYLSSSQIAMLTQWIDAGAPRNCPGDNTCADTTSPVFGGVTGVASPNSTTLHVCWSAATDAVTPSTDLRYDVYEATVSGGQNFTQPPAHTVTGETCLDVRAGPSTSLCFVVRARDLHDNRDTNTIELCGSTAAAGCAIDYTSLVQPIFSARCTHCHRSGSVPPPRFLDLSSYGGILAAGSLRNEVRACDWNASLLSQKISGNVCGRRMPFDGPPWLAPSEQSILREWVNSGARRTCADTSPCADAVAPVFSGISAITIVDADMAQVCWTSATDNVTATNDLIFDIYEASSSGGQNFTRPASYATTGGSCLDVPVAPSTHSCFVVRARDLAGNRSANSNELCVDMPGACVDYGTQVQPLLNARCTQCHSGANPPKGLRFDSYFNTTADDGEVRPCESNQSKMIDKVDACEMPRDTMSDMCSTTACLTPSQRNFLRMWIDQGANSACPNGGCP